MLKPQRHLHFLLKFTNDRPNLEHTAGAVVIGLYAKKTAFPNPPISRDPAGDPLLPTRSPPTQRDFPAHSDFIDLLEKAQ